MRFLRFLSSRAFLINLLLAIGISAFLLYGTTYILRDLTHNGQVIRLPDLSGLDTVQAAKKAKALGLKITLDDSASFNPQYPPLSVVQQLPCPGAQVKSGRTLHLTLNSRGYKSVKFCDIFDKSLREAEIYFQIANLKIGRITHVPYLAKGVVLKAEYQSKVLSPGDELPKFSTVDLILGKGLGNEIVHTPNLLGMRYEEAAERMQSGNFRVGTLQYDSETARDSAIVYRQQPEATRLIKEGSLINLWLSSDSTAALSLQTDSLQVDSLLETIPPKSPRDTLPRAPTAE